MLHLQRNPRFLGMIGLTAMILLAMPFAIACGPSDKSSAGSAGSGGSADAGIETIPTILSNVPLDNATGVPTNGYLKAIFSEEMDAGDINAQTFTLTSGATNIPGTVTYTDSTAVFWPVAHLPSNTVFVATINKGAKSASGVALAADHTWSFTTNDSVAPAIPVDLGTADQYAVLSKAGISTVPMSAITGNLGVSPAAATYITGFSLIADATNAFSTSTQVTGKVYAANYAEPTPTQLTTSIDDMELAFISAAARAPDFNELAAGNIGGMTLVTGVYKWSSAVLISTDVTLTGNATDVWIFQIAGNLNVDNGVKITLAGGALAKNVFWQVSGFADLGTTSHFEGIVLSKTSVTMKTGSSLNGRLLAQTAVVLNGSTIVEPAE